MDGQPEEAIFAPPRPYPRVANRHARHTAEGVRSHVAP